MTNYSHSIQYTSWVCMKQASFIIPMIMLGKKMLGNDIDVDAYELEKGFLIKELNELWTISVDAYDSFKQ